MSFQCITKTAFLLVILPLFNYMPPSPKSPEIKTDAKTSCLVVFFLLFFVDFSHLGAGGWDDKKQHKRGNDVQTVQVRKHKKPVGFLKTSQPERDDDKRRCK